VKITKLEEHGYQSAMLGISLSHLSTIDRAYEIAYGLARQEGGHNKFLESIHTWWDITGPRYWWQEFDTYRVGVSKQSESTMHTLKRRLLTVDDFDSRPPDIVLDTINDAIGTSKPIEYIKNLLPEGFNQRRIVTMNYKALRNILFQRRGHKLSQWGQFRDWVLMGVEHPEFLT